MTTGLSVLTGTTPRAAVAPPARVLVEEADPAQVLAYRALRRAAFVDEQGLFDRTDHDDVDDDPRTVVLVARDHAGTVLGGVRLAPATPDRDLGWWTGSRLVVAPGARGGAGLGTALVRAASALAESRGVLRFDAQVQRAAEVLFRRLGWRPTGTTTVRGVEHVRMTWPIDRVERLVNASKAHLAGLLGPGSAPPGFVGDDGAPVAGTDVIAACDAILPSMVERQPEWAGWCAVLVNLNDLAAMGAAPVALLDALGARDASFATRVMSGLRAAADAWGVPLVGGHTQLGVPASLAVTALGRTDRPVRAGGGRPGHAITVTADLGGGWRPGFAGQQWDSTSHRAPADLRHLQGMVAAAAPAAAKDVSMAGLVGTTGMLAEASGCAAVLDVASIPAPAGVALGDWVTCFPGFAMITTDAPGTSRMGSELTTQAECGSLEPGAGVRLRWPDGVLTRAVPATVTGLGTA